MKEEENETTHQFDVWRFAKNIIKAIYAVSKKKSCNVLQKLRKSVSNRFWWAYATRLSVLFHIQNKHKWRTGK